MRQKIIERVEIGGPVHPVRPVVVDDDSIPEPEEPQRPLENLTDALNSSEPDK